MFVAQMPNARRTIIHDAGHHPNMEHPDEFNRAVLSFLAVCRRETLSRSTKLCYTGTYE